MGGRRAIGAVHFVDEAAVGVGKADDARVRTAGDETALQALDEPGAERVEPFELGEVDIDAARAAVAAGRFLDDDLEFGRVFGGPGAEGGEREAFAVDRAGQ